MSAEVRKEGDEFKVRVYYSDLWNKTIIVIEDKWTVDGIVLEEELWPKLKKLVDEALEEFKRKFSKR